MKQKSGRIFTVAFEGFGGSETLRLGLYWMLRGLGDPQYGGHCVMTLRKEGDAWVYSSPKREVVPDFWFHLCPAGWIIEVESETLCAQIPLGIQPESFYAIMQTAVEALKIGV